MSGGAFRCGHDRAAPNIYSDTNGTSRCRACRDKRRNQWRKADRNTILTQGEKQTEATHRVAMEAGSRQLLAALLPELRAIAQRYERQRHDPR